MTYFAKRKDRIGPMSQLINVFREVEVVDSFGSVQIEKESVKENYWANVVYGTGSEDLEDAKIQLFQSLTITCRFGDFMEKDIVEHDGKFYDVFSVENFERNAYQRLKCVLHTEPENHE